LCRYKQDPKNRVNRRCQYKKKSVKERARKRIYYFLHSQRERESKKHYLLIVSGFTISDIIRKKSLIRYLERKIVTLPKTLLTNMSNFDRKIL